MRLAVVGAGWSGLAAAVRARQRGAEVTVYEMAAQPGGRARSLTIGGASFDNGQHILIGAYRRCLDLMRTVGVDTDAALLRLPLSLEFPDGRGLRLPGGPALWSLVRGVASVRGWSLRDRLALLRHGLGWFASGFRCADTLSVAELCTSLPDAVRTMLVDPLCIAALNTRPSEASASVLLRVLRDALLGPRGASDLLLPRSSLSALFADPAVRWLQQHGVEVRCSTRVQALDHDGPGWRVDGQPFDAVLLACTPGEAARLAAPHAPPWSAQASAIDHEAIVTVTLDGGTRRLPAPMLALSEGPDGPAQFVFDRGALGFSDQHWVAVASAASRWLDRPLGEVGQLVGRQVGRALGIASERDASRVVKTLCEKRATFACRPGGRRPVPVISDGLFAAGDYVDGPYPATLEGAVLSAETALSLCSSLFRHAESPA